jgi:hypothetical protein
MFTSTQQFFPTPATVARKLRDKANSLVGYSPKIILDPSAGKGDLLAHCAFGSGSEKLAIEIDLELQSILREKKFKVIGGDFFEFSDPIEVDLIVANPPFNRGVDHVLKAWQLVAPGGALVALLNSETLANQYTSERKRLGLLIQEYGGSEELGQCFRDAERSTDVSIVMLWMQKPKSDRQSFQFSGDFKPATGEDFKDFAAAPLASTDAIESLVSQYRASLAALKAKHQALGELKFHLNSLRSISPGVHGTGRDDTLESYPEFSKDLADLKYRFWWAVFHLSKMSSISTSDFAKKFDEFAKTQVHMSFDRSNISTALSIFFANWEQIQLDSIVAAFDKASAYHESNKEHCEGWKSNSGWKINKKIVVPWGVSVNRYCGYWEMGYGSRTKTFLDDFDQALCMAAGDPYDRNKSTSDLIWKGQYTIPAGEWQKARYYDFKLFKKGTIHIRFHNLEVLARFNSLAAKGKQWLGGEGF